MPLAENGIKDERSQAYLHALVAPVEGLNSVVRIHQLRHRRMNQELLNLERFYKNLRKFRLGRRQRTSP